MINWVVDEVDVYIIFMFFGFDDEYDEIDVVLDDVFDVGKFIIVVVFNNGGFFGCVCLVY